MTTASPTPSPQPHPRARRFSLDHSHWRLIVSCLLGIALGSGAGFAFAIKALPAALTGWSGGVLAYQLLTWLVMHDRRGSDAERSARYEDEGGLLMSIFTIAAVGVSLIAIVGLIRTLPKNIGLAEAPLLLLAVASVALSWSFVHTMFALHYARVFYGAHVHPGILFPRPPEETEPPPRPVYTDFLYTAFIIGTSAQTADVAFTTTRTRRIALVHSLIAFAMNSAVLALLINIAASLLAGS